MVILLLDDIIYINWIDLLDVFLRAIISLITLFFITKMLGKKQVSQLSLFDYVIGISIGNFAAEMTMNLEAHYLNGTLAVVIFGLVAYAISFLTMKSIKLRRFIMGSPTIVVQEGKLLEKGLKDIKLDVNDFLAECRIMGYFDLSQIEYAIMEVNGRLSILPKHEYTKTINKDLNVSSKKVGLCSNVIIDGKLMANNLTLILKDEKWLFKELKKQGYKKMDNILLATVDVNYAVRIYEYNCNVIPKTILE